MMKESNKLNSLSLALVFQFFKVALGGKKVGDTCSGASRVYVWMLHIFALLAVVPKQCVCVCVCVCVCNTGNIG